MSLSLTSFDLSPVRLNYVAALRQIVPPEKNTNFIYAQTGSFDFEGLLCLAASNPKGAFFGVNDAAGFVEKATELATLRHVSNIKFLSTQDSLPSHMDYLIYSSGEQKPDEKSLETIFNVAQTKLKPNGLFCCRYRAYRNADDILAFLVSEFEPVMSQEQAVVFLSELKALGSNFFADHPVLREALETSIEKKDPTIFFSLCLKGREETSSGTFDVMSGLLPRDFSFGGDADITSNYMDLVAPVSSHEVLAKCRGNLLYEPIKDFVLQRTMRQDVWVRRPVTQSDMDHELFDQFTYGLSTLSGPVPTEVITQGGNKISFNTPLYIRLIELMSTLPLGIGDFLAHPMGMGFSPEQVLTAIQTLVACGIAQPMRGRYEGKAAPDLSNPKWATPFNNYLTHAQFTDPVIRMASCIVGEGIKMTLLDALVLQAVNRVGLSASAGVLQPELKRLIQNNPAIAAQVTDSTNLTDAVVASLLKSTLSANMTRWYAYGLLAA